VSPGAWRRLGALVAGLTLGLLLSAVQVLPLLEYVARSDLLAWRSSPAESDAPPLWAAAAFWLGVVLAVLTLRRLAAAERGAWRVALVLGLTTFGGLLAGLRAGL